MDREILFRAKHIHAIPGNEHLNGTYVHGYLSDKNYINDKSLEGENMAKIFKISGYIVTENEYYDKESMENFIFNGYCGLFPRHAHVEEAEVSDWSERNPLLDKNCDLADCEKYFPNKYPVETDRKVEIGKVYKHFKGNTVKVLAIGQDTEAPGQFYVVYEYTDGSIWCRPYGMFVSEVDRKKYPDAKQKYRFELIKGEANESKN